MMTKKVQTAGGVSSSGEFNKLPAVLRLDV